MATGGLLSGLNANQLKLGSSNNLPTQPKNLIGPNAFAGNTQTTTPSTPVSMGIKAQNPTANIPQAQNTLPPTQVSNRGPIPTLTTPAPTASQTYTPSPVAESYVGGGGTGGYAVANPTPAQPMPQQSMPQTPAATGQFNAPPNSGLYGQLLTTLANNYSQPSGAYTQAQADYTKAVDQQNQLKQGMAKQFGNIESTPIPLEFQQGREQVLNRQYASQLDAAQGAVTQQQQALGYANTQQAQQQQALGTALGAAAPILQQYGQNNYNPVSGGQQGGVQPNDPFFATLQQYAHMYASNQQGAIPSSITSNPVLNAQVLQMAQQINPSFNYNTAQGAAAAQQSNTTLGGTATPQAYAGIYQQALGDYQNLQQSVQTVDSFGNLLTSNMLQGGINPSDLKWASKTLSEIRNQLSSGAQAQYDTTLAALRSKISGMLAIGGSETPTALTADAKNILDGSLPLNQLTGVLQRIKQEGNVLLNAQGQKVNNAKTGIGGGSTAPVQQSGAINWDSL